MSAEGWFFFEKYAKIYGSERLSAASAEKGPVIRMNLDKIIALGNGVTVFRDGEKSVKVFVRNPGAGSLLSEAMKQAVMYESGIAVPRVREVACADGVQAIVSDFAAGATLGTPIGKGRAEVSVYAAQVVGFQKEMHEKSSAMLPDVTGRLYAALRHPELPSAFAADAEDAARMIAGLPYGRRRICHGKLSPDNLIAGDGGKLTATGCGNAFSGLPELDAAITYGRSLCLYGGDFAEEYLRVWREAVGPIDDGVLKCGIAIAFAGVGSDNRKKLLEMI